MTNAELIQAFRAEIEMRIKECEATYPKDKGGYWFPEQEEAYANAEEYKQLLSFLDTLESEKPMNLDLEIEIEDYVEQRWQFAEDLNAAVPIYLYDMTLNELKDCARHFAKWGAEHGGSSETPTDLEEAAMNYIAPIEKEDGLKVINFSGQDIKDAFIAGYNLCKDALLEWAEDFKAKTGWYEIEVAMDDLIDKLNSM